MHLSYDGIVFDTLLLEEWIKEPVYDPSGTDFLYWHHVIEVVAEVGHDTTDPRRFPSLQVYERKVISKIRERRYFNQNAGGDAVLPPKPFPLISPNGMLKYKKNDLMQRQYTLQPVPSGLIPAAIVAGPLARVRSDVDTMTAFVPKKYNLTRPVKPAPGQKSAPGQQQRAIINAKAGKSIPVTENELRARLKNPRRQLLIWMYTREGDGQAEFSLVSPLTGVNIDAKDGPKCTVLANPSIRGNSSAVYRLRFETWEYPVDELRTVSLANVRKDAAPVLAQRPAILSNRWVMHQEPDPHSYLSNYVVKGTAIFNMGVLQALRLTADQCRELFMHPIKVGCVRLPPTVVLSPNGDAVEYEFTDKEVMTNFPAGHTYGMVSIDVKQVLQYHNPMAIRL